ncbi:formate dehydrogenase accessory sulfurtransferase FdhD [Pseudoroseicyclus tamaricis]|uniref:Sulfur carrier protein FdhD n=1 Tax=Pseudoroseicyclus tamaricis TaxID=2705421 RepID=A0A6B2JKB2_9RHOB|nr:formate dehydrogenase accessory sulfurtransferase FdhD [Pseudoroseicyclus tamaricis]NDV01903.1 formate dehydrogenase accessory sulfurtransferase FdhD [Pseudoroseicyclus tamaricis]
MSLPPVSRVVAGRPLAEEVPVALVFNGTTQAAMMATPADIEDFATGFALTEGLAAREEIGEVEVITQPNGLEARLWLPEERAAALAARRRAMAGPVGCGLCGIDSLEQAVRPLPRLAAGTLSLSTAEATSALDALRQLQPLHDETRAVHAAGFWHPDSGVTLAREDVGRHNALDKLIGALLRSGAEVSTGALIVTSRLSVEMVQKAVMAGAPLLVSVSAPTAHAVRLAEEAGLTLVSRAGGRLTAFSHAHRFSEDAHAG